MKQIKLITSSSFCRDRYIEHLLHQLEQLSAELRKVRADYNQETGLLRQELLNLEIRLAEKENEIEEAMKDKKTIERKLSEAAKSAQMGSVVQLQLDVTIEIYVAVIVSLQQVIYSAFFFSGDGKTS